MTKNPRDERVWTNIEVQEDAQGYLAAQQRRREDAEAEVAKRREESDKARFIEEFVAEGGEPDDAAVMWRAVKNELAAEATRRAVDAGERAGEAAVEQARRRMRQVL
jgi:hypothetical protein